MLDLMEGWVVRVQHAVRRCNCSSYYHAVLDVSCRDGYNIYLLMLSGVANKYTQCHLPQSHPTSLTHFPTTAFAFSSVSSATPLTC